MSRIGKWWTDGLRKGWLGRYERELVYYLREKSANPTSSTSLTKRVDPAGDASFTENASSIDDANPASNMNTGSGASFGSETINATVASPSSDTNFTNEQQLVVVFLSLFIKSGHTILPLNLTPQEWGKVVGLPPESIALLPGEHIHAEDLTRNRELASGSAEAITPLVVSSDVVGSKGMGLSESSSDLADSGSPSSDVLGSEGMGSDVSSTDLGGLGSPSSNESSSAQAGSGPSSSDVSSSDEARSDRVSFRKQFLYETYISDWIVNKNLEKNGGQDFDAHRIRSELNRLYPQKSSDTDWQKVASVLSVIRPFTIISGGPGTGKTTTVANLLALHIRLAENPLKIALAAPTGKAAGRMAEALQQQWGRVGLNDAEKEQIPAEASTLHRLLSGTVPRGLLPSVQEKSLPYDLIVVDEASMIDLQLMYRLLRHIDEQTTLILLGDRNQLASVEAGSVFSDLCRKQENRFSRLTADMLHQAGIEHELPTEPGVSAGQPEGASRGVHSKDIRSDDDLNQTTTTSSDDTLDLFKDSPQEDDTRQESDAQKGGGADKPNSISDSIVYLTKSYRYDENSGIGRLSEAILSGNADQVDALFLRYEDLYHNSFRFERSELGQLADEVLADYAGAAEIHEAEELLRYWKRTIRLTVLRHGPAGSQRLNRFAEQQIMLKRPGLVRNGWYHGRPFIITQNDYSLGIFNGDTGVAVLSAEGKIVAHVESGSGIKVFSPGQLQHAEPAYFLTVHKSQGSEFNHVHLILPRIDTPILSRELIYTAISRARKSFHLKGDLELFQKGSMRKTVRFTGL